MSDISEAQIQPVRPVGGTAAVQPARLDRPAAVPGQNSAAPQSREVAAATGGGLPSTYAQMMVNPDTHDIVIEVRDSATDQVIRQYPSPEIEAMNRSIQQYMETLARHHAAKMHGEASA